MSDLQQGDVPARRLSVALPADWKIVKLGTYYNTASGLSKPAEAFGSGNPFVAFKDVFNNYFLPTSLSQLVETDQTEIERFSVRLGDVFLTRTSETAHELGMSSVALQNYPNATFNGFTKRLRIREEFEGEVDPVYVGYFLRSDRFRAAVYSYSTMTTRASLNNSGINQLDLLLPPIGQQVKIGCILKSLDDKIALNRATNQTLEQMAQALFQSWFVDFDPVRAKAEGLKPAGMDEEMAALFPDSFEESALGMVPTDWEVARLGETVTIKRGGSPRPIHDYFAESGLPWLKIADATAESSPFIYETNQFIKDSGLSRTVFLNRGALILSNSATPGIPKFLEIDACIHDGWLYFPSKKHFTDEYLYFLFVTIRPLLVSQGNGSVFTNLKTDILKDQLVCVPPVELINRFSTLCGSLLGQVKILGKSTRVLAELRDALLPRLLNGEVSTFHNENNGGGLS